MGRFWIRVLAGMVVLLAGGVLHGYWTLRWYASPALAAAAQRLDNPAVPGNIGQWTAKPLEVPEDQLVQAGAVAWKLQDYHSDYSDVPISTLLLVGRPGAMTLHQPQHCYPGAGFEVKGARVHCTIRSRQGEPLGDFWTARFERQSATGAQILRIFWSWNASGKWRAPENPRWTLASEPALFKLYVIREATKRSEVKDPKELEQEPAYLFLQSCYPD